MKVKNAPTVFKQFAGQKGLNIEQLSGAGVIDLMIDFYSHVRADECDIEEDGDMLLFQWGLYRFEDIKYFEYDITRQLIIESAEGEDDEDEEERIWQLSLTAKYKPSERLEALGSGNRWCEHPRDLDAFKSFISGHEATSEVKTLTPDAVVLVFDQT